MRGRVRWRLQPASCRCAIKVTLHASMSIGHRKLDVLNMCLVLLLLAPIACVSSGYYVRVVGSNVDSSGDLLLTRLEDDIKASGFTVASGRRFLLQPEDDVTSSYSRVVEGKRPISAVVTWRRTLPGTVTAYLHTNSDGSDPETGAVIDRTADLCERTLIEALGPRQVKRESGGARR